MPQTGSIPSSWLSITGMLGAQPHLRLLEEVTKRGVDPHDLPAVSQIWRELNKAAALEAEALARRRAERAQAAGADQQKIETLTHTFPGTVKRVLRKKK